MVTGALSTTQVAQASYVQAKDTCLEAADQSPNGLGDEDLGIIAELLRRGDALCVDPKHP